MIYLGSLGRMIGIKCPASQNVQAEERYSFSTTLEGRRKAQAKPVGRRSWSLQTSDATTPAEHSLLSQFANGAWGNGPFVFVSADAPHTNLLTPAASMCEPDEFLLGAGAVVIPAGPVATPEFVAAKSFLKQTSGAMLFGKDVIPCLPGVVVTASVYALGDGGRVGIVWYDEAGNFIRTDSSSATSVDGVFSRLSVTALPPATAVGFRVQASALVTACTMPSATWSGEVFPFSTGQGCARAVVHGVSSDLVLAVPGSTYSNLGFTVSEVG